MANESARSPFTATLTDVRRSETLDFRHAWVGMEPTFTDKKTLKLWRKLSADEETEEAFFDHPYLLDMEKSVAKAMLKKYEKAQARGETWCVFDRVERERDLDQWGVRRQNLHFRCAGDDNVFTVRLGLDPETYEFSIKPVPLVWLYDRRFVRFLQELVWDVPQSMGLRPSMAHGGCQYSLSAKTYLTGSLLCDDIADKFNHPELSSFTLDFPNGDDRCFRATARRREAFFRIIEQYWAGAFHPRVGGRLTAEHALMDRAFLPFPNPPAGLMEADHGPGPVGDAQEVFQTNFSFARAVRMLAQNVHPGYWQSAHPDSLGYRPDQIMRYSEGNLNRLRIRGELHVKSDEVLQKHLVPEFDAPLTLDLLYDEASWENRAQYGRSSARDFVEAVLLDVHRARYLSRHPGVRPIAKLAQDQLYGEAEEIVERHGRAGRLAELRREARAGNLEDSNGRIKSDFIEPDVLFWEAWWVLPARERALIAHEAISAFVGRVEEAASCDPRRTEESAATADAEFASGVDAMEWHRHRVQPLLWQALQAEPSVMGADDPVRRELERFVADSERYLSRRAPWSFTGEEEPWLPPDGKK